MYFVRKMILLLILALFVAPAANAETSKEQQLAEIYYKSGLEEMVRSMVKGSLIGFDMALQGDPRLRSAPKPVTEKIQEARKKAFSADRIVETVKSNVAEQLTPRDLKQVLAWLDSSIGRKCRRLEQESSSPDAYRKVGEFLNELKAGQTPPKRLALIEKFDKAQKYTESLVGMHMVSNRAMIVSFSMILPEEKRASLFRKFEEMEAANPPVHPEIQLTNTATTLLTYQGLDDGELEKLIAFYESESGSKFQTAVMGGMKKAYFEAGFEFGRLLGADTEQFMNRTPQKKDL